MATAFDPYHRWLGIGPKDQPPNHYRLLGLDQFESDPDVIENAADRQMRHIRGFQSGEHADESQQILNEISAAKLCLLTPDDKAEYDKQLKAKTKKPKKSKPLAKAAPLAEPAVPAVAIETSPPKAAAAAQPSPATAGSVSPLLLLAIGGGGIGLLMLAGIVVWASGLLGTSEDPPGDVAVNPPPVVEPFVPPPNPSPRPRPPVEIPNRPNPPAPQPPVVNPPRPNPPVVRPAIEDPPQEESSDPEPQSDPHAALLALLADESNEDDDRHPLPDEEVRAAKEEVIAELFPVGAARTSIEKSELAKKLLQTGKDTTKDHAAQYVLFDMARGFAAEGGDSSTALEAIDLLDESFQVDGNQLRIDAVATAAKVSAPQPVRTQTVKDGISLVDQLFDDEQYVEAGRMVAGLSSVARYLRDRELIDALSARRDAGRDMFTAYKAVQSDIEKFRENTDDAEAALAIGKYFAFAKGNWQRGLPFLAAGSDDTLKGLAEAEMAVPTNTKDRKELGDRWYDSAADHDGLAADRQKARAAMWYGKIENSISGLSKVEVTRRLQEVAALGIDGGTVFQSSTAVAAIDPPVVGQPPPKGEVDLLALVDVSRDSANGVWTHQGQDVVAPSMFFARLSLPCRLPDEYILDLEVTSEKPALDVVVGLTSGENQFSAIIEGFNSSTSTTSCSGLGDIDGKRPTTNETQRRGRWSKAGEKNHLRYEVRDSVIRVTLNDEPIIEWRGNHSRLTPSAYTYVKDTSRPYLGSHGQSLRFHSAKLTSISGEVRLMRSGGTVAQSGGGEIDLLALVDTSKNVFNGNWKKEDGNLVSSTQAFSRIQIPYRPPEEYDLHVDLTRVSGQQDISIGLVYQGKQCHIALDRYNGRQSDLMVDMRTNSNGVARFSGKAIDAGVRSRVTCQVRKDHIKVMLGDKELFTYRGDPNWSGMNEFWKVTDSQALMIGAHQTEVHFHSIKLTPVGEADEPDNGDATAAKPVADDFEYEVDLAALKRGKKSIDLMPFINPDLDAIRGKWTKRGGDLLVPNHDEGALLQIPHGAPEEYILEMELTRLDGYLDVGFALPMWGYNRTLELDMGTTKKYAEIQQRALGSESRREIKVFDEGERKHLVCIMQRELAFVGCNGETVLNVAGKPTQWGHKNRWTPPCRSALAFGALKSQFAVHSITLTPLRGEAKAFRRVEEPPPAKPPMGEVYLDDMQEIMRKVAWGELGKHGKTGFLPVNPNGKVVPAEVVVGGKKFKHALSMQPPTKVHSHVAYALDGNYRTFTATVAIMDANDKVRMWGQPLFFEVYGDGKSLWKSEKLTTNGQTLGVSVDVTGVRRLDLRVGCPGQGEGAWAVWLDPKVVP